VWQEELPPGLYSIRLGVGAADVEAHAWQEPELCALAHYTRSRDACHPTAPTAVLTHADRLLAALDGAVARRVASSRVPYGRSADAASVLVLFSGGVDSCLLAALAHRHVPAGEPIDLANVCFRDGASADRLAALSALAELQALAPTRTWRLIAVAGTLDGLAAHRQHLLRLLSPRGTLMDLNIGSALWLAARGHGMCNGAPFNSAARIVLMGTGADEQAAGYSRHRTTFMRGGDVALAAELECDVRRLWYRNLGRDDRLVSDCGREARFPFLDEAVVACLAETPLHAIADLAQPAGTGDKRVLRDAARAVGLRESAARVKRAIQFGCGVSAAANVHAYGSSRAANARGGGKCSIVQ
jgi:asparagine synthetase B (glutamine-hydrolysing)